MKWLIAGLMVVLFTGCTPKEPQVVVKTVMVYEKPYPFETLDLAGTYIELGTKELQRLCTPSLIELDDTYKGVIEFYKWQIKEYEESRDDNKSRH